MLSLLSRHSTVLLHLGTLVTPATVGPPYISLTESDYQGARDRLLAVSYPGEGFSTFFATDDGQGQGSIRGMPNYQSLICSQPDRQISTLLCISLVCEAQSLASGED
jgi:hypothetical protein